MKKLIILLVVIPVLMISCENQAWEFPDYDYTTVYFAYQGPVRVITLGEDIYDTTLDNEHKCKIMATMGGVYKNKNNVYIDIKVDESLCENLLFSERGDEIIPMPSSYYKLASNQIVIPSGELYGGVEVQLTDAFFADPLAIKNTYVIPLYMVDVQNADSILRGGPMPEVVNPNRYIEDNWLDKPKDYILYAIKYVNPWHGSYLRRGKDVIKGKTNPSLNATVERRAEYVEKDELCYVTTRSMQEIEVPLNIKDEVGNNIYFTLILTFDESGKCRVTGDSGNYTVSGSGEFVEKGDKKSWGNEDRDVIYLSYEVDFDDVHYTTLDTLVLRSREVAMETFTPVLK